MAQERKEKKWHMHLSRRRMKFFTVSLYPGIQPPEGAWAQRELNFASCLDGFSA